MENKILTPKELAEEIVRILDEHRARDIKLLYVEKDTSLADYYIIATGNSFTQVRALCDEVDEKLTALGNPPARVEGEKKDTWLLMDFYSVAVHLMTRDAREFYKLDKLWQASEEIDIAYLIEENDQRLVRDKK